MKFLSPFSAFACSLMLGLCTSAHAEVPKAGALEMDTAATAQLAQSGLDQLAILKTKEGFAVLTQKKPQEWVLLGQIPGAGKNKALITNPVSIKLPKMDAKQPAAKLTVNKADPDSLHGTLEIGGQAALNFTTALATGGSFFRCGNHPQAHLARAIELKECEAKYGCTNWSSSDSVKEFSLDPAHMANVHSANAAE